MRMKLAFSAKAVKDIEALSPAIGRRIVKKMKWFVAQNDPMSFAKMLTNSALGTHRFRVGDYRVLVEVKNGSISILMVLTVKQRKDAYQL